MLGSNKVSKCKDFLAGHYWRGFTLCNSSCLQQSCHVNIKGTILDIVQLVSLQDSYSFCHVNRIGIWNSIAHEIARNSFLDDSLFCNPLTQLNLVIPCLPILSILEWYIFIEQKKGLIVASGLLILNKFIIEYTLCKYSRHVKSLLSEKKEIFSNIFYDKLLATNLK